MPPTAALAAPCGFVGWTVPSPRGVHPVGFAPRGSPRGVLPVGAPAVQSLHLPLDEAWLGITMPCGEGFPEFGRVHLGIAPQAAHLSRPLCR